MPAAPATDRPPAGHAPAQTAPGAVPEARHPPPELRRPPADAYRRPPVLIGSLTMMSPLRILMLYPQPGLVQVQAL